MTVKLLTENHLEFLSFKAGCTGSSESIHVKMLHCWKSRVAAHMYMNQNLQNSNDISSNVIYFYIKLQTKHYRFYGISKQLSLQALGAKSHYCILVYTL